MINFRGILPAVVTPFTQDRKFSPQAMEQLVDRFYTAGVHGLYICGQTGEGLQQDVESRQQAAEVAVRCSPKGKLVIVHVGAHHRADAMKLARHAQRIGASAISSLPPRGRRRFIDVRQYYRKLASSSELPLLVYHFPETCSAITSAEQILELCEIPNIVGLKFTDFDLFKLWQIKSAGKVVFNGKDEILAAGLLMGADGGIGSTYNLLPQLYVRIYDLAQKRRWAEARRLQDQANELITIILRFPLLPVIKAILKTSGIDCGPCLDRPRALTTAQHSELRKILRKSSFADYPFAGSDTR
jgi:N-acetylneuraminate lyase